MHYFASTENTRRMVHVSLQSMSTGGLVHLEAFHFSARPEKRTAHGSLGKQFMAHWNDNCKCWTLLLIYVCRASEVLQMGHFPRQMSFRLCYRHARGSVWSDAIWQLYREGFWLRWMFKWCPSHRWTHFFLSHFYAKCRLDRVRRYSKPWLSTCRQHHITVKPKHCIKCNLHLQSFRKRFEHWPFQAFCTLLFGT